MTELRQRTDITLNEKQRKQEREDNEKQRLSIENIRRKAKGMELLTELKSDEDKSDKKKGDEKKDDKDKVAKEEDKKEPDALLFETGNILSDLMSLSKSPAPELQAQQQNQQ
jgi:carboxyl-terminal processing protease